MAEETKNGGKRDFFISYTSADQQWAEWIAFVLEENKYTTIIQAWDFRGNFVQQMDAALRDAERTIAVLSDNYFKSDFTLAEWTAQFATDPVIRNGRLIPLKVGHLTDTGLLGPIIYAELHTVSEKEAERRLLEHVKKALDKDHRSKPKQRPVFLGLSEARVTSQTAEKPRFPTAAHNLPLFNHAFVGREDELAKLHDQIQANAATAITQPLAITGLGGIGKTQLALAYAYRHLADYQRIHWLAAEDQASLATDYIKLAPAVGLSAKTKDQPALIESIRNKLETIPSLLMIFDNVTEPSQLTNFMPNSTSTKALITTRYQQWGGMASGWQLGLMSEDDAVALLLGDGKHSDADIAKAKELGGDLGYLALALSQARAFMSARSVNIDNYRSQLQEAREKVNAWRPKTADYPHSLADVWQSSIDAATEENPAASTLLELLAFLAPDDIPRSLIAADDDAMPEGLKDRFERDDAIEALARYSLLTATPDGLSTHRLVQQVTLDRLDETTATERLKMALGLLDTALPSSTQEHTNWRKVEEILPSAEVAIAAAEKRDCGEELSAELMNELAIYHQTRANFALAEPLYRRAIAIGKKVLGSEHRNLAARLNNLAELFRDTGRFEEAEPLYRRAIAISEKVLGPEHPDHATSLSNLALLLNTTGRFEEAEPLCRRAVEIGEKVLGPEHPDLATYLNVLANLLVATDRFEEAELLYRRAMAITEKIPDPEYLGPATTCDNLACLLRATGRFDESESLFLRAIAITEKVLGPEHPRLAIRLNNLASLLFTTERLEEAEPLCRRCLAIWDAVLPDDHPNIATGSDNIADLLEQLGRNTEAATFRAKAEAIRAKRAEVGK